MMMLALMMGKTIFRNKNFPFSPSEKYLSRACIKISLSLCFSPKRSRETKIITRSAVFRQDDGGSRIRRSRSAGHEGVDGVRVGLDALVDRGREETGERARERRRPPRGVRAGRRPPPLPEETVLHRRGGHGPSLQGIRSPVRRLEGVLIRSRTDPTGFVASSRRDSSTDTFVN